MVKVADKGVKTVGGGKESWRVVCLQTSEVTGENKKIYVKFDGF